MVFEKSVIRLENSNVRTALTQRLTPLSHGRTTQKSLLQGSGDSMASSAILRHFINENRPLILDGGLSTELEEQGAKLEGDPLWSARLLHTDPQAIKDAHYRFLLSGADVITTVTYQASIPGFISELNMRPECARELLMSGVHLAKEMVEKFGSGERCPLVAGSIGAYGAHLHDGSEYTGTYAEEMSVEDLKAWHRPHVESLLAAGADMIAFETIPSIKEAEALVELLKEFPNSSAWLSFSCKDEKHISDGSKFSDAVQVANRSMQLFAVGVNCCPPHLVEPLLDSARSQLSPDKIWVVYPNSGEDWDTEGKLCQSEWKLELGQIWEKQGASLIGGCCCIGPAQIAELRQVLKGACTSPSPAGQPKNDTIVQHY